MKVNKKILLVGVLLGIITIFFLNRYISSLEKAPEEVAATSYTEVVVALTSIPEHVRITQEMVQMASIPVEGVHPDAVKDMNLVVGAITRTDIINGEQILAGRIVNEESDAGLSYWIPENMRAISIPLGTISGVSNFIQVGDKVDILATYEAIMEEIPDNEVADTRDGSTTYTQFQNVEVMALGSLKPPNAEKSYEQPGSITLLVTPEEAEVLAWVTINGSIHMTLRNPIDNEVIELERYGTDNFESFRVR